MDSMLIILKVFFERYLLKLKLKLYFPRTQKQGRHDNCFSSMKRRLLQTKRKRSKRWENKIGPFAKDKNAKKFLSFFS